LDYQPPSPIEVLLIGCEDGDSDTVIPRLLAAGADMDRVHTDVHVRDSKGNVLPFSLVYLGPLGDYLEAHPNIGLIIIDPITGYVGRAGVRDHHDAELRTLLEPLADMANRRGVTILTIKHLNKDEAKTVASRVGGSIAYVNVPRACFVVAQDPENEARRVLAPFKWNLNAPQPPSLAWTMEPPPPHELESILADCNHLSVADQDKLAGQLHRLVWQGTVEMDADDLLRTAARVERKTTQNELDRATDWLRERLAEGPVGSVLCSREGDKALGRVWPDPGLSRDQRRRSVLGRVKWWREKVLKDRLGGSAQKHGFRPATWFFRLPDHAWPPGDDAMGAARQIEEAVEAEEAEEASTPGRGAWEGSSELAETCRTEEASENVRIPDVDSTDSSASSTDWEEGVL
jgi:hypothetical protein